VHTLEQGGSATHLLSPGEFAMILNSESRGVCVISPEGLCRFVTPSFCRMFGVRCEEVIGRVLPSFLKHLSVRPGEPSPSSNREHEVVLTRKDGSAFPARVRMEELALEGPNTGSVYFVEDLTEEKHMEYVLRKTEKLASAGRMAAAIAHEINNPLEAVTNLLYLLRSEPLSAEAGRYLSLLESEVERVSRIARQTLAFYRDKGRPTRVDVRELLNLAVDVQTTRSPDMRVHRRYRTSEPISGFASELQQVFHNLISNAIDSGATDLFLHTRRCVEAAPPRRTGLCITVGDNGSGVDPTIREQLFHPFITTKGDRGTGLGLWTSRGIVVRHEGTIRVRTSTAPERSGTSFHIFLPC
jgi:PAS domain S-box-containing protein